MQVCYAMQKLDEWKQSDVSPTIKAQNHAFGVGCETLIVEQDDVLDKCTETHDDRLPAYSAIDRCGCAGGGKGLLISKEKTGALACGNNHIVFVPTTDDTEQTSVYMTEKNGRVYKAETAKTMDRHGLSPITNQGGYSREQNSKTKVPCSQTDAT